MPRQGKGLGRRRPVLSNGYENFGKEEGEMSKQSAFQPPPEIIAATHQENEEKESVIKDQVINKYLHHPHEIGPYEVQDPGHATQDKKDFCVQKISLHRREIIVSKREHLINWIHIILHSEQIADELIYLIRA